MAQVAYFSGIDGVSLEAGIRSLRLGLDAEYIGAKHMETRMFTQERVAAGDLVILGMRNPGRQLDHWVLVLGVEGMQKDEIFTPHTLLVIDPVYEEPWMCGYNGRLELNTRPLAGRPAYIRYTTNDGTHLPVTLHEAIAVRRRPGKKGRKPLDGAYK